MTGIGPVTLRRAAFPADAPVLRALIAEYVANLGLDLGFQDVDGEIAALPGAYAAPQGAFLIAECGAEAVGIGALRPLHDGSAELKRMYLRPAARGLGAGRALALALIGAARHALSAAAPGHPARLYRRRDPVSQPRLCRNAALHDNPLPGAMFMALDLKPGRPVASSA